MKVNKIVYLSRATISVDRAAVAEIAAAAAERNRRRDVTGALTFCGGYFLQILEGPADALEPLVEIIRRDARHTDFQIIDRRVDVERTFADWNMAGLHEARMSPAQGERFAACVKVANDPALAGRLGADAYRMLDGLQDAICAEMLAGTR